MDWVILTGFSVLFRAIYGVMTKILSNKVKVSAYTQAALMTTSGAVISFAFSFLLGGLSIGSLRSNLPLVALVVMSQGLGNIFYFAALKNLSNSTAQITFSSVLIFNTLLALIFLNLNLNFINIFGLTLLFLAVISVTTGKVEFHKRGVALMLVAAFSFAIFQLSSGEISKEVSAATYLFATYVGATLVVFGLKSKTIIKDISTSKLRPLLYISLATGLFSLASFLFAYHAYRGAPQPAKVAMLLTSQVVIAVLLSYIFLNEKTHLPRKLVAAVLVVIAAIMIKQ